MSSYFNNSEISCKINTVLKGLIGHLLGKNFWKNVLLTGGGFSVLVYKLVKKNPENVLLTHCPINPFKTVYYNLADYHF